MEHNTGPAPFGARPGGDGWTPYGAYEGAEDSRLQEVDKKLDSKLFHMKGTTNWRSTSCNTRGKPRIRHPGTMRTRMHPRTKTTQDLGVRHGIVRTGNPGMEVATNNLAMKTSEEKEVKTGGMVKLEQAKYVSVHSTARTMPREGNSLEESMAICTIAINIMGKEKGPENTSMVLCTLEEKQTVRGESDHQVDWSGNRWRRTDPPNFRALQGGHTHQPSIT